MEGSNPNGLKVVTVESVESTEMITEDLKILQNLNINLQIKNHNLENEVLRLKQEIQNYKGKTSIYDSLSKDLASLRKQCDKTAIALLRKCEAYDALKKENTALKAQNKVSPQGTATPIRSTAGTTPKKPKDLRKKLAIFDDGTDYSSDDEQTIRRRSAGRPSMGSCGNITEQIMNEEAIPTKLKTYGAPNSSALRNRVLIRLHSLKSASTESLESAGRKSLRVEEKEAEKKKPSKIIQPVQKGKSTSTPAQQGKTTSTPASKVRSNSTATAKTGLSRVPPSSRPALGQTNDRFRLVRMNSASVKRSNSNCSTKSASSANSSISKPAFRC